MNSCCGCLWLTFVQDVWFVPPPGGFGYWSNWWQGLLLTRFFTVYSIACSLPRAVELWQDLILPLLPAIQDFFNLPTTITACQCMETVNFEGIQLSTQGAERQRKDVPWLLLWKFVWCLMVVYCKHVCNKSQNQVLKLASRFEALLKEQQAHESSRSQNESELLAEIIGRYNAFKANSAIKKWQISADQSAAIWCIIIGLDETSRSLLRSHLDHNKWEESGSFAFIGFFCVLICSLWMQMPHCTKATVRHFWGQSGTFWTQRPKDWRSFGRRCWQPLGWSRIDWFSRSH